MSGVTDPSEEAVEIIEASDVSPPIVVFRKNMSRIRTLLRAGIRGVESSREENYGLIEKFSLDGKDGEFLEEGSEPIFEKTEDGYNLQITKSHHEAITKALSRHVDVLAEIPFYLHNILCVALWSSFEGYVQGVLAALYRGNIEMLSSEKVITFSDVISSRENIVEYLVAREIDDVGRRSFKDLQSYLKSKIKVEIGSEYVSTMNGIYY